MDDKKEKRIDKFIWAVRIFINNIAAKPSRTVVKNEIILVKKPPVIFTYRVIEPIEKRVSAKLVEQYIVDLTSEDEKSKLDLRVTPGTGFRTRGTGRPTKKERRLIDKLNGDFSDL
jgi:ribosome-associated heat shock protein Hsp15